MDDLHRKVLRQNRTKFIENIAKPLDVNELLFEYGIFTEGMKQEVEAEKTQNDQTRKILDTLPKRGPKAFDTFYSALVDSANVDAAHILRPDLAGNVCNQQRGGGGERGYAIPQPDADLPTDWPNEEAMTAPIDVKYCDVRSQFVIENWLGPRVYSMKKAQRGTCLIISNKLFTGPLEKDKTGIMRVVLSTRYGTEKDLNDLKLLFTQLHFNIVPYQDLTAAGMTQAVMRESQSVKSHDECFVCIICSHGTNKGIYGTDGDIVPIDDVTAMFDGQNCKALINKPKLFFIQACRGEGTDNPTPADHVDGAKGVEGVSEAMSNLRLLDVSDAIRNDQTDATPFRTGTTIPTKADILVACATHPGYVSLRNKAYGSWFIQAVIHVFQKYAFKESILDMLTLVNELVARGKTATEGGGADIMQAALSQNSFRRKLYFFPGIIDSNEAQHAS